MVELQLLQRRERPVTLLGERERMRARLRLPQVVVLRHGLAQERNRDEQDRDDGDDGREDERGGHASASAYRAASRRCSRGSGQSATSEPARKTNPASQIRLTSGLTSARK